MALIQPLVVMATFLLVVASADTSCQGKDWKSKTLEQRAGEPDWIAFVQVASDEMLVMGKPDANTTHEVVVNVTCWLKKGPAGDGDDDSPPKTGDDDGPPKTGDDDQPRDDGNMTVSDAGHNITIILEKVNCKSHTLEKGKKYVLFMEENMGMFKIVNVNAESGALLDPKDGDFEALHRGIYSGMTAKPDGECVDDVNIPCFEPEGEYDKEACDGSASVMATVATVMVAAILAIATF